MATTHRYNLRKRKHHQLIQNSQLKSTFKSKSTSKSIQLLPDDKLQSRNDWKTRPLITREPVYKNVYLANFEGSKKMLELNSGLDIGVLNLESRFIIEDSRSDNSISIEDSAHFEQKTYQWFVETTASRIEKMAKKYKWLIVNCWAGINRASPAFSSYISNFLFFNGSIGKIMSWIEPW